MTFPIIPSNSASGIYSIDNSLRFNDNDSAYLNRTPSSASNRTTWTWSAWIKRSAISTGNYQTLWNAGSGEADDIRLTITNIDQIIFGTDATIFFLTSQLFRDVSAWYNIVFAFDTTQGTASDRAKLYINGSLVSSFSTDNRASLSGSYAYNNTVGHGIGRQAYGGSAYYDGYMAEVNFIDGQQLDASSFGEFDSDSGIWKPIEYTGTYGTNGFYLDFENSGSLGADQSGNGNNFTPTNLASTDQMIDTPTNNWCTLNSLFNTSSLILKEGNLHTESSSGAGGSTSTYNISNGKWYFETCYISGVASYPEIGIMNGNASFSDIAYTTNKESILYRPDGKIYKNNGSGFILDQTVSTASAGDIIGIAINLNDQEISFYVNNTQVGSTVDISYMSNDIIIRLGFGYHVAKLIANFGQDSSFAGNKTRQNNSDSNGYGDFYYAPPTGFLSLNSVNLATALSPTIDDGSQYFNTVLTTGAGAGSYTGVGFQPDFLWFKRRDSSGPHFLIDSTRGSSKYLASESTASETTDATFLTSIDSDGWTGGSGFYGSPATLATWNWKGGTTSSNTDGSITSTVQANTTAGFSIVTYTGTGSNATIGHGLGKSPSFLVTKARNTTGYAWIAWHSSFAGNESIELQSTDAKTTSATAWNSTVPTSSVFSVGTRLGTNASGTTYVAYCFAEIEGYSSINSYTGNGSTDGTFVYTGFKPAFIMVKRTDTTQNWVVFDNKRDTFNVAGKELFANLNSAENDNRPELDLLSNGFKFRATYNGTNASGGTYIYMAFAENPFVTSTGIPVTAR